MAATWHRQLTRAPAAGPSSGGRLTLAKTRQTAGCRSAAIFVPLAPTGRGVRRAARIRTRMIEAAEGRPRTARPGPTAVPDGKDRPAGFLPNSPLQQDHGPAHRFRVCSFARRVPSEIIWTPRQWLARTLRGCRTRHRGEQRRRAAELRSLCRRSPHSDFPRGGTSHTGEEGPWGRDLSQDPVPLSRHQPW